MSHLTLIQLRQAVSSTWEEIAAWLVAKPRICRLPHPEQQIQFEYAVRLREKLRASTGLEGWDRLYFDGTTTSLVCQSSLIPRQRAPLYLDTRQLLGGAGGERTESQPDVAIALQVLRSSAELLTLDGDGRPREQAWLPTSLRAQGWLLEEHVKRLDQLATRCCDGFLFVVYYNEARRSTSVDQRQVASWASWHKPTDTLWWASRHFRAKV